MAGGNRPSWNRDLCRTRFRPARETMAKTTLHLEGGREGAPDTITLGNDRLTATLRRHEGTYQLSSLLAGGECELLAEATPLLVCFDGTEHAPVLFTGAVVEPSEGDAACLRFAGQHDSLDISASVTLRAGRPYLEVDVSCRSHADWSGLVYFPCAAAEGFVPVAYPWIAGDTLTDRGYAYADSMGVPLLMGDPRGLNGHILAVGAPLAAEYRSLLLHYHPDDRRVSAGIGDALGRPAVPEVESPAAPVAQPEESRGLLARLFRRRPEAVPEPEPASPASTLSVQVAYAAGKEYRLPLQVWGLTGEYRNLASEWMKGNGFAFAKEGPRSMEDSLRMTLAFLKEGAPFIAGKGYPMRASRLERVPGQGTGGLLHLYGNAALAYALYACWAHFREDWMRERALAIIEFVLSARRPNGIIPEALDPQSGQWTRLGEGAHYEGAGLCIDSLLRLHRLRHQTEKRDDIRLRRAADEFLRLLFSERRQRIDQDRRHGRRRHDQETTFPYSGSDETEAPNVNLMIAMERIRQATNERRVEFVRQDAEKWILHNVYQHMSWRGGDAFHRGLDARTLLRFIEYCVMRRDATQGKRYLDMAEILASYVFFTLVPKDLEWCAGPTRGLQVANGDWRALTVPFADHLTPAAALHRLGKITNDRFYAQLADHMVFCAMRAQCDEEGVPGYGGWLPALNAPDGTAFPLNSIAYDSEVCITSIVPAVLETCLWYVQKTVPW